MKVGPDGITTPDRPRKEAPYPVQRAKEHPVSILSEIPGDVYGRMITAGRLGLDDEPELKGEQTDEFRPTADVAYNPTELDEVEWSGMVLRLSGEPMGELVGTNSTALLLRFAIGQSVGLELRQREEEADREAIMGRDARHGAYLAEMEERYAGSCWHEAERAEAVGVIESRRGEL
jgi:hypothetical protein